MIWWVKEKSEKRIRKRVYEQLFKEFFLKGREEEWVVTGESAGLRNGLSSNGMNYLMFTMQLRMDLALKIVA